MIPILFPPKKHHPPPKNGVCVEQNKYYKLVLDLGFTGPDNKNKYISQTLCIWIVYSNSDLRKCVFNISCWQKKNPHFPFKKKKKKKEEKKPTFQKIEY